VPLENLRKMRKEKGLSQTQAAAIFGVSLQSYNAWEMGDFEPDITTLKQMADYFHTTVDYIIDRKTKDFTPDQLKILDMAADIIKERTK